jgi:hypothetical protein
MKKSERTPFWKKKEYWAIAGVIGAVITVIPGLQIPGLAITAGVSAGIYYFGVKDGEKTNTPIGITNVINKLME